MYMPVRSRNRVTVPVSLVRGKLGLGPGDVLSLSDGRLLVVDKDSNVRFRAPEGCSQVDMVAFRKMVVYSD